MVADCSELGLRPEHWVGSHLIIDGHDIEVDWEMVEACEEGMAYIAVFQADPDCEVFIETRVSLEPWCGLGEFGTSDVAIVNSRERWIIIFDWKYGMEPVWPEQNDQCYGYCLGFWNDIAWKLLGNADDVRVTFVIEQPRVPGAGGAWETTMSRVLEFGDHVRHQAFLSQQDDAPRTAGEKQCRWCRARDSCGTHATYLLEIMGAKFEDIDDAIEAGEDVPLPPEMTPERRTYILKHKPMITRWFEGLHKSAYSDAVAGNPVPGMVLVPGRRPPRVWEDTAEHKAKVALKKRLGAEAFKTRMVSPAEAEKLVGKVAYRKTLARFVNLGEARPILADAKDTRDPIESTLDALARYTEEDT